MALLRTIQSQLSRQFIARSKQVCQRCLSTSENGLDLQFKEEIAVITMAKEDNRINSKFLKEFNGLLDSVLENKSCKGLITTGDGKFYGNGIDLSWASTVSPEEIILFSHDLNKFFLRLIMFPLPTLAQMNGHAFAGGAVIALAHDLRTMNTDKGWFCLNEVHLSVRFSELMMALLRAKLGDNLSDAVLLARRYTGEEALQSKLVSAASPMATLDDSSTQLLRSYLTKHGIPRTGVSIMKQHMYQSVTDALNEDLADNMIAFAKQFMKEADRAQFKN